jgi:AraC family transcriptional activator of pobA
LIKAKAVTLLPPFAYNFEAFKCGSEELILPGERQVLRADSIIIKNQIVMEHIVKGLKETVEETKPKPKADWTDENGNAIFVPMQSIESFLTLYKQNNKLCIRLISHSFGHLPPEIFRGYGLTHRKEHYFLIFMLEGTTHHGVDLQKFAVKNNELLFILPHQIHELPPTKQGTYYYKLGFDEHCLSLLPKQFAFLVNPFNAQKIQFISSAAARLKSIFEILQELLSEMDTDPELVLAHLNSLLTEINAAYFSSGINPADNKLSKYISFKLYVENNLREHPSIIEIADKLALNTNSLYNLVKHYSGLSPKEFINKRLILEAKRRLYYSESSSIKELAYELGFNDPDYFSRLFKKSTGKTVASFVKDLSGN